MSGPTTLVPTGQEQTKTAPDSFIDELDEHFEKDVIPLNQGDELAQVGTETSEENAQQTQTNTTETGTGTGQSAQSNDGSQQRAKEVPPENRDNPNAPVNGQDLVLPDGTRIRAGKDQRLFRQGEAFAEGKARQALQAAQQQFGGQLRQAEATINQLQGQVSSFNETMKQFNGMSQQEVSNALTTYKAFLQNPVAVISNLLAQARDAGYDIQGVGGSADLSRIEQRVNAVLSPLEEQQRTQQVQQQREQQAQSAYMNFLSTYPDVVPHEQLLGNLLARSAAANQPMTPEQGYVQLKLWAQQQGLDWTQPLAPQIQAKQQQQGTGQQDFPMNGRTGGDTLQSIQEVGQNSEGVTEVSPETSYDDIIRNAMQKAGMNTQAI